MCNIYIDLNHTLKERVEEGASFMLPCSSLHDAYGCEATFRCISGKIVAKTDDCCGIQHLQQE
jgi:hypothetical protein